MEENFRKLMDIPIELRAGILKHVSPKSAFTLRQVSSQLQKEIETFGKFGLIQLSDWSTENVKAQLKLPMTELSVDSLMKQITLPLLKHPHALRKLKICSSSILPENFSALVKESGKFLRNIFIEFWSSSEEKQNTDWLDYFQSEECKENMNRLKNVEKVLYMDYFFNRQSVLLQTHYKIVEHFLEIPLCMPKLKSLELLVSRNFCWDGYFEFVEQVFKIIAKACDTLLEFVFICDLRPDGGGEQTPTERKVQTWIDSCCFGNAKNLKKISWRLAFGGLGGVDQRLQHYATYPFFMLLNNQINLELLLLNEVPCVNFVNLMEIVGRNCKTLEKIGVTINGWENMESGRLDFSALGSCEQLILARIHRRHCTPLKVIGLSIPKSLLVLNLIGFRMRTAKKRGEIGQNSGPRVIVRYEYELD